MAKNNSIIISLALLVALLSCNTLLAMGRPLLGPPSSSLAVRLRFDEQSSDCWGSMAQLQACSGEIVTFFLTGEADLGDPCCRALRIIGEQCWPNMLGTLGFTAEEGEILEGYCVKSDRDQDRMINAVSVPRLARINP